jgi:hypothetical protein
VDVGTNLFPMSHVAFWSIVLFVVLLWPDGCEPLGFGSSVYSVLMWFVCICMCS